MYNNIGVPTCLNKEHHFTWPVWYCKLHLIQIDGFQSCEDFEDAKLRRDCGIDKVLAAHLLGNWESAIYSN